MSTTIECRGMWSTQLNYVENPSILWKSAEMTGEMSLFDQFLREIRQGRCEKPMAILILYGNPIVDNLFLWK